jgi:hypothetical protein
MPEPSQDKNCEPLPKKKYFRIRKSAPKSTTKKYLFEGVERELKGFVYKHQMTLDDCRRQYASTLFSNESRARSKATRAGALPDEFGEGIVRFHFPEYVSFKSSTGKKGDMLGEIIRWLAEVKTSTSDGPSSFGPISNSNIYFFCDVNMKTSEYSVYVITREILGTAVIDKSTTLAQQWEINKNLIAKKQRAPRPRFSIRSFVRKNNLVPEFKGRLISESDLELMRKEHEIFWGKIDEIIEGKK